MKTEHDKDTDAKIFLFSLTVCALMFGLWQESVAAGFFMFFGVVLFAICTERKES